jgi:hypothetical protein
MAKTRLCSSSTTIIIGVNAVKESSIMGSEKDHNSPVKNCAFPMPKLQSSLLFAEQVTIRSVPGTPHNPSPIFAATLHTAPFSIPRLSLAQKLV